MIDAISSNDMDRAGRESREAESLSREIVKTLDDMIHQIKAMSDQGQDVF